MVISSAGTPQSDSTAGAGKASNVLKTEIYVIGSGDQLAINVWKNVDLSKTMPVRPDGHIS